MPQMPYQQFLVNVNMHNVVNIQLQQQSELNRSL